MKKLFAIIVFLIILSNTYAQEIIARWSFDKVENSETIESVSGKTDLIKGYVDPVKGVVNNAIRFDGFTGYMERERYGSQMPEEYTINVWLAGIAA